jgi:hypothetical protein
LGAEEKNYYFKNENKKKRHFGCGKEREKRELCQPKMMEELLLTP